MTKKEKEAQKDTLAARIIHPGSIPLFDYMVTYLTFSSPRVFPERLSMGVAPALGLSLTVMVDGSIILSSAAIFLFQTFRGECENCVRTRVCSRSLKKDRYHIKNMSIPYSGEQ
jgi:hypothetical protein